MRIGLTYTGSMAKHRNYVDWLKGADLPGELIEVVKFSVDDNNLEQLQDCDGLVLSGGVDIHPALYGGELDYKNAPVRGWEKERDLFERSLFEYAMENGLPTVGVCRGLQLVNVTLHGTLVQDLGEQGDATHENVKEDKRHSVSVEKDSLLYAIAGHEKGEANSAHHQAIDKLGEGLRVNSRADDGTIEGIEWAEPAGKTFMLAVQWHPERMFTNRMKDSFLYGAIRDRFFGAIREKRK